MASRRRQTVGHARHKRPGRSRSPVSKIGQSLQQRKLRLEALEPRYLLSLSNVAITTAQRDILVDGLSGLADWADTLDGHDLASQLLPAIGQSVGETLDLGDLLRQGLAQPISDYFAADPTDPSTDELVTALTNLNGASFDNVILAVANVSGGKSTTPGDNELVFQLEFQADRSVTTGASLGPEGESLGILHSTHSRH
jgi:hypothetical protein